MHKLLRGFFCFNLLLFADIRWWAEWTPELVCLTNGPITCQSASVGLSRTLSVVLNGVVCLQESHPFTHFLVFSASTCDLPPEDGQVVVKGLPENNQAILPDRFLRFSCEVPGKYLNGSSLLVCGKDGQWDKPFPTCEGGNQEHCHRKVQTKLKLWYSCFIRPFFIFQTSPAMLRRYTIFFVHGDSREKMEKWRSDINYSLNALTVLCWMDVENWHV